MKLKNKKTGAIYSIEDIDLGNNADGIWLGMAKYNSLAELNEEWCDYEEQKGNWTIDPMNENYIDDGRYAAPDELERYEELGLKFNTEEEAEKAVEKLKALTKLCKKGFEFNSVEMFGSGLIRIEASIPINEKTTLQERSNITDSLYLLFGGEE